MPTPLTPDEEFDAHFRRGLEHPSGLPDAPDAPDAWQRMEALLDAAPAPRPPSRVRRGRGVAALLLLLLVAGLGGHYQRGLRQWAAGPATSATQTTPVLAAHTSQPATTSQPASQHSRSPEVTTNEPAAHAQPATTGAFAEEETTASAASPVAAGSAGSSASVASVAVTSTAKTPAASASGPWGNNQPFVVPTVPAAALRHRPAGETALLARHRKGQISSDKSFAISATAFAAPAKTPPTVTKQPTRTVAITTSKDGETNSPASTAPTAAHTTRHRSRLGTDEAGLTASASAKVAPAAPSPIATRRHARRADTAQLPATEANVRTTASRSVATALSTTSPTLAQPTAATDLAAQPQGEASSQPQAVALLAGTGLPGWRADSLPALLPLARVTPFDSLQKPKELPVNNYRLHIGLLAAPELSAVHQRGTGAGGSIGVQIEYQLARRWRLSTGYLQAIKRYAAGGSDYRLLTAWPSSWALTGVTANCRIIDVPLNLRYDVWQQPQRRAFVSGGLSSLFMRREDYTYQYEVNGKPYSSDWQFLNYSNHPFQVLNLSVGYEQNLSPRWALQVEPYLKLPLGGVGYGAVRLQSAGIFFSLKYGLLRGPAAR